MEKGFLSESKSTCMLLTEIHSKSLRSIKAVALYKIKKKTIYKRNRFESVFFSFYKHGHLGWI